MQKRLKRPTKKCMQNKANKVRNRLKKVVNNKRHRLHRLYWGKVRAWGAFELVPREEWDAITKKMEDRWPHISAPFNVNTTNAE